MGASGLGTPGVWRTTLTWNQKYVKPPRPTRPLLYICWGSRYGSACEPTCELQCVRKCVCTRMYTQSCELQSAGVPAYAHACIRTCMCVQICIYTHAYAYTCTYIQIQSLCVYIHIYLYILCMYIYVYCTEIHIGSKIIDRWMDGGMNGWMDG